MELRPYQIDLYQKTQAKGEYMAKFVDLTGKTFGRLTVIGEAGRSKSGYAL